MTSALFMISVFLAGIFSFFSPCILPLLPVYAGVLVDRKEEEKEGKWHIPWTSLLQTLSFILGLSTIFVILGFGAGFLGETINADWFRYLMGTIVIVLGLHQMGIFNFHQLQKQKSLTYKQDKNRNAYFNAFLLGLTFSFGWTPCVGPVLSSVLALAASGGSGSLTGGLYMIVYTIGLSLPFLLLALASSFVLKQFSKLKLYMGIIKKIGGLLIVLMGILLLLGNVNFLAQIFGG